MKLTYLIFMNLLSTVLTTKDTFSCEKLSNGCRLKKYQINEGLYFNFIVCRKLSQSFSLDIANKKIDCQYSETRLLLQLFPSEILDSSFDLKRSLDFSINFFPSTRLQFTNIKGFSVDYFSESTNLEKSHSEFNS